MLRSFSVKNFYSFRESVRISLELDGHAPQDDRSFIAPSGARLTKALAIIGANASGKTTLVKALAFLHWFINDSFQLKTDVELPLEAHFSSEDRISEFELEFESGNKVWRYQLKASAERVYTEALYAKEASSPSRFSYVFVREWEPKTGAYKVKQQQFGMLQKEAEKVRINASLISTAAQYGVPLALQMEQVTRQAFANVHALGRNHLDLDQLFKSAKFYADNDNLRKRMATLLSEWDLGLADIQIHKVTHTDKEGKKNEELDFPFGVHRVGDKEHELALFRESSGTQSAFILLAYILPALEKGGLVLIDEMEADLHPQMLPALLDLFFSPESNPHNAQIIFTSHSIEVMTQLHKAQVVLVEKDTQCESDAWRLDEVKGVRADDNLYAKYMAGAYGAIPKL